MKHLKICVMAFCAVVLSPIVHAAALQQGQVQALLVVGKVELVDAAGNRKPLTKGMQFTEGNVVQAGDASGATLVFSNGATMRVTANAQLAVTNFKQAPFDADKNGTFIRLQSDPSQSITELDLRNGTLQGEVKKLNIAEKSSFTVNTPAGSAGIRGTIVSITVVRDSSGNVIGITANCATGAIAFSPAANVAASATTSGGSSTTITNSNVNVNAGATVSISVSFGANGSLNGVTVTGAGASSAAVQDQVNQLFAAINQIRSDAGVNTVPPPTVTATTTVTTGSGDSVSTTTTATFTPTSYTGTALLGSGTPGTPGTPGTSTASTGTASTGTASTGSAGTGPQNVPTNPSVTGQG